jgi:hypothetical protein
LKPTLWLTLAVGTPLLCAPAGAAEETAAPAAPAAGAPTPTAPQVGSAAAGSSETTSVQDDLRLLREEILRLRREAEEQRRAQEARIRALETKLQEAQKAPAAAPPANAPNPVTTRPGFKARLYGFARADIDIDSRKMFAHPHLPFYALSPGDPRANNRMDGDFTIHPRLTRLGLDTEATPIKDLWGAKPTGKIEVDFFNFAPGVASATSNSRQFIRMRHGYGQLEWKNFRILFGQTWDLISPLYPTANDDVLMWNAGNLGDRRPQLRATWEPKVGRGKAIVSAAVLSADAVGGSNRDGDLALDGEESKQPLVQGRLAINQPSWVKGQTWEFGVWGHHGAYRFDRAAAIGNTRSFHSNAVGFDLRLPLTRRLLLQGEGWWGKALADIRGGVGQDINAITGDTIRSMGGWAELQYQVARFYTVGGGFTIDDPTNSDVTPFLPPTPGPPPFAGNATAVGRTLNRTLYLTNRFNLGSGFTVGVDWMLFHTEFRGLPDGENNRWNIWLRHGF